MSLLSNDLIYVQRGIGGSKDYDKLKVSITELESHFLGVNLDAVNEIDTKLDQEIQDRIDGDQEIYDFIDGLTDRLSVLGEEVYDTLLAADFTYKLSTTGKDNYDFLVRNCDIDDDECRDDARDVYLDTIAGGEPDSSNSFFLVSGNYTWQDTESIFLSDTLSTGEKIDLDQVTVGSIIEIIGYSKSNPDVIDNFNYGFYKVKKLGGYKEELFAPAGGETPRLYRFDVTHVGSAPRLGKPSLNDGENRYQVKLVLDLVTILSDAFVNKTGDTMSGSLIQTIEDPNEPFNGALIPGFQSTNLVQVPKLILTGYSDVTDFNPSIIDFPSTDKNKVSFASGSETQVDVYDEFSLTFRDEGIIEFYPNAIEIPLPDNTTEFQHLLGIKQRTVFHKTAEYQFVPDLLTEENIGNNAMIPPRAYVDAQDQLLQNAIEDVSVRIDTLANASDVYQYKMLLASESNACDSDLASGTDNVPNPPQDYPGYDPNDPTSYDPTKYDAGIVWAKCISQTIANLPLNDAFGLFHYGSFVKDTVDDNGDPSTEDVDVFVVGKDTNVLGGTGGVYVNFQEVATVGDYFEVSSSDARTTAYAVYIITDTIYEQNDNVILTCRLLFKSDDDILSGFNYKIKFYDKTSGLNVDDTDARYLKLTGGELSGPLGIRINKNVGTNSLRVISKTGEQLFNVTDTGEITGKDLTLGSDGAVDVELRPQELNFYGTPSKVKISNELSNEFEFVGLGGTRLTIFTGTVDVHSKQVTGVTAATEDNHAVPLGQLFGRVGGGNALFVSKDKTLRFTVENQEVQINAEVNILPLKRLDDVEIPADFNIDGAALVYDGSANAKVWRPSAVKMRPFEPGNQVAYYGTEPDTVEVGGFWLNKDAGTLQMRIN